MACRSSFSRLTMCLIVTAFLIAAGCSSDGNGTDPTITGPIITDQDGNELLAATYTLQEIRVRGDGIDTTLSPPAATGTAVATSDARFTSNISIPSQNFEASFSGNYSVSGNTLTLNWDDGTVEQWTISADRSRIMGAGTAEGFTLTQTWVRE